MMRFRAAPLSAGVCLLLSTGCASEGPARPRPQDNVVTADQIMASGATTAYEALQRLRPVWLGSRGPSSLTNPAPSVADVYINGVEVGDVSYLQNVHVEDVLRMRFYPATEAGARYGMNHPGGVIEVTMR